MYREVNATRGSEVSRGSVREIEAEATVSGRGREAEATASGRRREAEATASGRRRDSSDARANT